MLAANKVVRQAKQVTVPKALHLEERGKEPFATVAKGVKMPH